MEIDMESDLSDSDLEFQLYSQLHYCNEDSNNNDDNTVDNNNDNAIHNNNYNAKDNTNDRTIENNSVKNNCHDNKLAEKMLESSDDCSVIVKSDASSTDDWEVLQVDSNKLESSDMIVNVEDSKVDDSLWSIPEDKNIPLNGALRYYMKSRIRCRNCDEAGHVAAVCPKPRKKMPCYLCGKIGHFAKACRNSWIAKITARDDIDCNRCGQFGHIATYCPDYWRQFHVTIKPGNIQTTVAEKNKRRFCYNCSKSGHFGHKCKKKRRKPYFNTVSSSIFRYDTWIKIKKPSETNIVKKKKKRKRKTNNPPQASNLKRFKTKR